MHVLLLGAPEGKTELLGGHVVRRISAATVPEARRLYQELVRDLAHSVSAGLDYASIGPEHAALHDSGRAEYVSQDDAAALDAVVKLARTEGILPALESAHAVAEALKIAPAMESREILVVNLSGRGDKDMGILARELKL